MILNVTDRDGKKHALDGIEGWRVMEIIRDYAAAEPALGIKAECGGALACATCHVYVTDEWIGRLEPASGEEIDMLDGAFGVTGNSRLSCQILMSDALDGLDVALAPRIGTMKDDSMSNLDTLKKEIVDTVKAANDMTALEDVRVTALGKKGKVTSLMQTLGKLSPEERKEMGQALNRLKDDISAEIDARAATLKDAALAERLKNEKIDVSLSIRPEGRGTIHPISQTIEEMIAIFADMGFSVAEGPEIEDDFHNFTALNFPPDHPARQMHDTFYLPDVAGKEGDAAKRLLRTHTSTVQVHTMQTQKPPIRVIIPGRTFRSDYDMTHTPMFHQLEGLLIDKTTHMGHLKGCLIEFCRRFFDVDDLPTRFRPSFFPFTEPSAEMDIGCSREGGELKIGAGKSFLEVLGCGMVHPNVLKNCGIDPNEYQGFAFGMGIERMAMLKYGIPDLRTFFESDLRWLKHYGFGPMEQPNEAFK